MMAGQREWLDRVEQTAHAIGKHGGRNAHRQRCDQRAGNAGDGIADQRDDQHVRPRRELRDRKHIGELLVGHPVLHVDRDPVHFRNRGIRAADRKQRHQRRRSRPASRSGWCREFMPTTRRRITKLMAMLSGIATSNTAGNGSRSSPIATNTAASTTSADQIALSDQRHHHPENHRYQQADRRAGHAGQNAPQVRRPRRSAHRAPPGQSR